MQASPFICSPLISKFTSLSVHVSSLPVRVSSKDDPAASDEGPAFIKQLLIRDPKYKEKKSCDIFIKLIICHFIFVTHPRPQTHPYLPTTKFKQIKKQNVNLLKLNSFGGVEYLMNGGGPLWWWCWSHELLPQPVAKGKANKADQYHP